MRNPVAFKSGLENFFLLTYTPPAERVRPHLPQFCELETFVSEGIERAWISTGCFHNLGFHWDPLKSVSLNFWQTTYRTYVRYRGHATAYFFATDLETLPSAALQGAFAALARKTKFDVELNGAEDNFIVSTSNANHNARFFVRRSRNLQALDPRQVERLTMRPHGIFRSNFGVYMDQIVSHVRFNPIRYELVSGRFDLWHQLGILKNDEDLHPQSVYMQPFIKFKFYPPLPAAAILPGPGPKKSAAQLFT